MPKSQLTYEKAIEELETIVRQLESGQLELDSLTPQLKRAQTLFTFCQSHLKKVSEDIQKLLDNE